MPTYLTFIGTMNVIGTCLLLGALNERFSDALLRRWTWIIPQDREFRHSDYSRVWLWWAIIGTAVFSGWNIIAANWPAEQARIIVWGDVVAYGSFEALAIAGSLSRNYGPGIHVAHVLWIGQAGWGVFAALSS